MPKRTDIESILIIGAGPIVIGQACEFDYSGAQACKALREEGYRVILVNSNPATIMTDPDTADAIYIEPVVWPTAGARIIEREKPDALLPTMGGQTALNCALDLVREGVLEEIQRRADRRVREAIDTAEDRDLFRKAMIGYRPRGTRARRLPTRWKRRWRRSRTSAFRPSSGRRSRWAAPAAASPTTAKSSRRIVCPRARPVADHRGAARGIGDRLERVRDGGGPRLMRTTASSSARSRTSIRWACTPATRSRSRRRRR